MENIVNLAAYTYRQLVLALDKCGSFRMAVDPSLPWSVPPDCECEPLPRRLTELHRMIDSTIEPQDRIDLDAQLSQEIYKMKTQLDNAKNGAASAIQEVALIDSSWRIDAAVRESIAKLDLNAVYQCRRLFASMIRRGSELSPKDEVLLEQAIFNTHRAMELSGLNGILIAEQSYLRQFLTAATENENFSAGDRKLEQVKELPKDWIANVGKCQDWLALAEGGLRITGAIIALALVIYDHDVVRGAAFAAVWNPVVEMLVGADRIHNGCNSDSPDESHQKQNRGSKEQCIVPVLKS